MTISTFLHDKRRHIWNPDGEHIGVSIGLRTVIHRLGGGFLSKIFKEQGGFPVEVVYTGKGFGEIGGCSKKAAETEMKQMHREESTVEGNFKENKRDNAMIIKTEHMGIVGRKEGKAKRHQQEEVGQQKNGKRIRKTDSIKPTKTKGRKWKFQARERAAMGIQLTGPASLKRSMEEKISPSPESKKRRMGSPTVKRGNQLQISSSSAKLKLV
ncbi:hypothetical protein WN943_009405 [Citrus x changshan-huyou]